jgi:hypothetical protein
MREINKISEALFEKVRDRFEDVSLGDAKAKATQNPEEARFFNFDYVVDGQNYGNITLSLIDEISLKIYFSKNISQNLQGDDRQKWYAFLRELREFSKRNLLSFEPRDITRSTLKHRDVQQVSKADSTYTKDEVVAEGRMYGTSRSSYENDGDVRLIVRHTGQVDPERRGDRSRKIKSIYVETAEGERFKLPHNNLRYARAMARHVSEGGTLMDDFGQHITRIAEECGKLRPFKNSMRRRTFEDQETQAMVEAAFEYHGLLNNTLKRMSGRKGYAACKESFHADETLLDDFDVDSLRERFVKRTYNERMEDALPIVHKAYEMKKSNKFAEQFESWANNIAEGYDDTDDAQQWGEEPIDVDDLADAFAEEIPLGVDAINATSAISGIINSDELESQLVAAAKESPSADARDIIIAWVYDNAPAVYQELMNEIGDADTADEYGASGMDEPNVNEDSEGTKYGVYRRGGSLGSRGGLIKTFDTKEEAQEYAKRQRKHLTPGERSYYKMGYNVKAVKDEEVNEGWSSGSDRVSLPDGNMEYWDGKGPLQDEYNRLYDELVPSQGKADTIEGEVLRAASKIYYRHHNDGDEFNQASFDQLEPYIGTVTSYDDLAHKAVEFALKANGNYTPNPDWDSVDAMDYGPVDDDDDYDEDDSWDEDDEDEPHPGWDDEDEDLAEGGDYEENTYDDDNVEAIQTAILRRILGNVAQHSELLRAVGPEGVMNAARDVASFHAPVDELGSSDISIMVREVYQEAGVEFPELNEGRMKEVAMDIEELSNKQFYAKYKMSKEDMKAKLAESSKEKTPGIALSKAYKKDFDDRTSRHDRAETALTSTYSKTGKPGGELKKRSVEEAQGDDYVNKKEKLARAGAHRAPRQPEQSFMDKVKSTAKGAKAWVQGKDDSMYESEENDLAEMRRLAGLK